MSIDQSTLISIIGTLIALFSLFLSSYTLFLDRGLLSFNLWVGNEYDIESGEKGPSNLFVSITNIGRRPVTLKSIGGDSHWNHLKKLVHRFIPQIKPSGAMLTGWNVSPLLFDNGKFRVLSEGETVQSIWPLGKDIDSFGKMFSGLQNFYVEDTTQKRHRLTSQALRKLVKDIENIKKDKKPRSN